MNNLIRPTLVVALLSMTLSCSSGKKPEAHASAFATSLRVFALVLEEITGDRNDIHVLISDTQSPHAFHPRPSDMNRLSGSTLLILGDPELDGWAEELGDLDVLYLSNLLQPSDLLSDRESPNPHFWTDPQLIRRMLNGLTANLCSVDPNECQHYQENAIQFDTALSELDNALKGLLQPLQGECIFTAQPFFEYFLARYGIVSAGVIEAVPGYEPSAAHLVEMLERAKTMQCIGIIAQRRLSDTSARLFSSESDIPLIYLDPIGNASVQSYAEMLQRNAHELLSARGYAMIHVHHLTVRVAGRDVLQDVTFEAVRGNFVAVLGPNGGGKSTLLKTILGLHRPAAGSISIDHATDRNATRSIGYVPQIKSLDRTFPARSVELVLTSVRGRWPAFPSQSEKLAAIAALEEVGADHLSSRSVSSLSGGELQRVYLARAIIQKPALLLLDEPESGIDISGAKDLYTLLESNHRAMNTCIVMVTHDWDVAYHHASHALLINGRCYGFGPTAEALTEEAVRNTFGHVGHKHAMLAGGDAATSPHEHV